MGALKLGFIGAGNMATAVLGGVLSQGLFQPEEIVVADPMAEKLEALRALGVRVTADNRQAARAPLVILAVKPQVMDAVLAELGDCMADRCVVSIAPGVSTGYIQARLPGARVVRVMPNTPLLVGKGATAIALSPETPEETFDAVVNIFASAGEVFVLPEEQMNAIVAVSGSSPAFFFRMADAMVAEAARQGIDPEVALRMTARTMEGAAVMLLESGKAPGELTRQVCSPGGTTLAALTAFDELEFDTLVARAMERCTRRAGELGR